MLSRTTVSMIVVVSIAMPMLATVAYADGVSDDRGQDHFVNKDRKNRKSHMQLGPRPFYLALVCRHSQCDLHTTTDILSTPLAAKCSVPFSPAEFDPDPGALTEAASAQCCTSDITLDEFKRLYGKMDASNPNATTAAEFLGGTPSEGCRHSGHLLRLARHGDLLR